METVFRSNSGASQHRIVEYLREIKARQPEFKVVDIGGASNPWSRGLADAYVDMRPVRHEQTILGDVHDERVWEDVARGKFDFCICSHTLEDLRDPLFVLSRIERLFRHGYIAVPNKHVEFNNIESRHYVGFAHHRWIFSLTSDGLTAIAKFPFASHFAPRRRGSMRLKAAVAKWRGRNSRLSSLGPLPWWDRSLADRGNELAFIWKGPLRFQVINGDYAGDSTQELALLYRDSLAEGI